MPSKLAQDYSYPDLANLMIEVVKQNSRKIRRVENVSKFEAEALLNTPGQPFIIVDDLQNQKGYKKWTFEFFYANYGEEEIQLSDDIWSPTIELTVHLSEFINYVQNRFSSRLRNLENPRPLYSWGFQPFTKHSTLLADIRDPYCIENWFSESRSYFSEIPKSFAGRWLFIGPEGTVSNFHQDFTSAWIAQYLGSKKVMLFSPDHKDLHINLNRGPTNNEIEEYFNRPGKLLFSDELRAGETLIVPHGWWHYLEALSPSISASFNFLNSTNVRLVREKLVSACPKIQSVIGSFESQGTAKIDNLSERKIP